MRVCTLSGDTLNNDTAVSFKTIYSVDPQEYHTVQIVLSAPKGKPWHCCLL